MLKIGLFRLLGLVLLGVIIPFFAYRLSRLIGTRLVLVLAVAVGLVYGAVKADNPWSGDGLFGNLTLMATSAVVVFAYVGLTVGVAAAIATVISKLR